MPDLYALAEMLNLTPDEADLLAKTFAAERQRGRDEGALRAFKSVASANGSTAGVLNVLKGAFDEGKHPRDHGKFAEKGGGAGAGKKLPTRRHVERAEGDVAQAASLVAHRREKLGEALADLKTHAPHLSAELDVLVANHAAGDHLAPADAARLFVAVSGHATEGNVGQAALGAAYRVMDAAREHSESVAGHSEAVGRHSRIKKLHRESELPEGERQVAEGKRGARAAERKEAQTHLDSIRALAGTDDVLSLSVSPLASPKEKALAAALLAVPDDGAPSAADVRAIQTAAVKYLSAHGNSTDEGDQTVAKIAKQAGALATKLLAKNVLKGTFDESKVHRDHGKFARTEGGSGGGAPDNRPEAGGPAPSHFPTTKHADAWGKEHFGEWGEGLSKEENWAVNAYIGGGYEDINGALRDGTPPDKMRGKTAQVVEHLDAALSRGSAPHALTTYRGVRGDFADELVRLAQSGGTLVEPAYLSTSLVEKQAGGFARNPEYTRAVLEIAVPKGSPGAYPDALDIGGEGEWLMPRGAQLQLTGAQQDENGVWRITASLAPGAVAKAARKLRVIKRGDWDESKHKRDHGKFSSTGGGQETSQETRSGHPADAKARTLMARIKEVPRAVREKVTTFVLAKYRTLAERYGETGAKAVLAGVVLLTPVPVPGTSLLPIAIAECVSRIRRAIGGVAQKALMHLDDADIEEEARALLEEIYEHMGEAVPAVAKGFDPNEKRDESGKWTSGGASRQSTSYRDAAKRALDAARGGQRVRKDAVADIGRNLHHLTDDQRAEWESAADLLAEAQARAKAPKAPAAAVPESAAAVHDMIRAGAGHLDPDTARTHAEQSGNVLARMPPAAHARLAANLSSVYVGLGRALGARIVADSEDYWKETYPNHYQQLRADALSATTAAMYSSRTRTAYMPAAFDAADVRSGKDVSEFKYRGLDGLYAHELTHAIDGPGWPLSSSADWQAAFAEEIKVRPSEPAKLTKYAATEPAEGFAEFGRALYSGKVPLAEVESRFPKCAAVFKAHSLWPAESGAPTVEKAARALLAELFAHRVKTPDGHLDVLLPDPVAKAFDESKVHRDHGKFAEKDGARGAHAAVEVPPVEHLDDSPGADKEAVEAMLRGTTDPDALRLLTAQHENMRDADADMDAIDRRRNTLNRLGAAYRAAAKSGTDSETATQVLAVLERFGAAVDAPAGETVPFDPTRHESAVTAFSDQPVRVVRPAILATEGDGQTYVAAKGAVEPVVGKALDPDQPDDDTDPDDTDLYTDPDAVQKAADPEPEPEPEPEPDPDAPDDANALLLAALVGAVHDAMEEGEDAEAAAEAFRALIDDPDELARVLAGTVGKSSKGVRFDPHLHPRDDHGRWVSRDAIHDAKVALKNGDSSKADALRAKVTGEIEREKLDDALEGKSDLGRTQAHKRREEVAQRRANKEKTKARADELIRKIQRGKIDGADVTDADLHALADHLPHMTVADLRRARLWLDASFKGDRRKAQMVERLRAHVAARREEEATASVKQTWADYKPGDLFSAARQRAIDDNPRALKVLDEAAAKYGKRRGPDPKEDAEDAGIVVPKEEPKAEEKPAPAPSRASATSPAMAGAPTGGAAGGWMPGASTGRKGETVDLRKDGEARFQESRKWASAVEAAQEAAKRGGANLSAMGIQPLVPGTDFSVHDLFDPGLFFASHVSAHGTAPDQSVLDTAVKNAIERTNKLKQEQAAKAEAVAADDRKANRVRNVPAYRNDMVRAHGGRIVRHAGTLGAGYHAEFPTAAHRERYLAASAAADAAHRAAAEARASARNKEPATAAQIAALRRAGVHIPEDLRFGTASLALDLHNGGEHVSSAGLQYERERMLFRDVTPKPRT